MVCGAGIVSSYQYDKGWNWEVINRHTYTQLFLVDFHSSVSFSFFLSLSLCTLLLIFIPRVFFWANSILKMRKTFLLD